MGGRWRRGRGRSEKVEKRLIEEGIREWREETDTSNGKKERKEERERERDEREREREREREKQRERERDQKIIYFGS